MRGEIVLNNEEVNEAIGSYLNKKLKKPFKVTRYDTYKDIDKGCVDGLRVTVETTEIIPKIPKCPPKAPQGLK